LAVQEVAEEGDQSQAHPYGEGAVPESIHRRLPGPIPHKGCSSGERQGKEHHRCKARDHNSRSSQRVGDSLKPVPTKGKGTKDEGKLVPGERRSKVGKAGWRLIEAERSNGTEQKHEDNQRDAQTQQAVFVKGSGSLAVERAGREVPGDQEEAAHEIGLIDEYEYQKHQGRQLVLWARRVHVVEGSIGPVDRSQMEEHHQDRKLGPQVVEKEEAPP